MAEVTDFDARLESLDLSLFDHVPSQTTPEDRASLLALHNACRQCHGTFRYLEIGSHLGGSLQALVADPRCTGIISIDSRPPTQPDARFGIATYPDNRTERMLDLLREVPGADLGKLRTFDASTEDLDASALGEPAALCFIDGEHTDDAALRDARFCRQVVGDDGALAFHDFRRVHGAIRAFAGALDPGSYTAYRLESSVLVIELGEPRLLTSDFVAGRAPKKALAQLRMD
jgi:hypothetical protein